MQIRIREWIDEQDISEEARSILEESLICYRSQAWRSALLMSYVGFLTIVKDRILNATIPNGFPETAWAQRGRDLRNPDKWDANTFSCTQQRAPAEIFIISDDLRHQVEFWKNRRNDCAHSKPNLITAGHVESFYSFLISNASKFVVNGSRNSLFALIQDHFNPDKTPLDAPINNIISMLNNSVEQAELNDFLTEVFTWFDQNMSHYEQITGSISSNKIKFIDGIFNFGSNFTRAATLTALLSSPDLVVAILRRNNQFSNELSGRDQLIRSIWRGHLFTRGMNDFSVLCSLINNGLIPIAQHNEVFERIFSIDIQPNEIERLTLYSNGFGAFIRRKIDNHVFRNFHEANRAKKHIVGYLSRIILDRELCIILHDDFEHQYVADELANALNNYFSENTEKVSEYQTHGISAPSHLSALSSEIETPSP